MKRILFSSIILICLASWAQGSTEQYYRKAEGLSGTQLKAALHDIIQPALVLGYGGGPGKTWSGFWQTDQMEDLQVRDRYSNTIRHLNPDLSAVAEMNIEHIWANSWWGHVQNNAYKDLFNLYPADATANGRKSNNPIGVVDGSISFQNGVTKVGKSSSYRADSLITAWEPADQWKGDFARTYFYMATCYSHMTSLWTTTEGLLTVDPKSPLLMRPWVYNLMLEWAEADPLDEIEKERNEAIFDIQGNRNPFVDYPELCHYIWGEQNDRQFYCTEEHGAEVFVPMAGEEIDLGLQPLSRPFSTNIQVRGRGLSDGLKLSTDRDVFALAVTDLSDQQTRLGTNVPMSVNVSEAGSYEGLLKLEGSGFMQQVPLHIAFVDGIPAYAASNIVCSTNSRHFNANWMNYEPDATYTLNVYTRDASGNKRDFGTYQVSDTTYQVNSVLASTTYYYTVSLQQQGQTISSNEVEVEMPAVAPVFTVSTYDLALTATPRKPSAETKVSITAIAVPKYVFRISTSGLFELSADGEIWEKELTLSGQNPVFFVRFAGAEEEGEYEADITVSTEGLEDRIIAANCMVDQSKSFYEDFENGSKTAYAVADVKCTATTWNMSNAMLASDANALDKRCVRMKGSVTSNGITTPGHLMMMEDKANGCDSLWFYAGKYGTDTGVTMSVSYSTDQGKTWTKVAGNLSIGAMKRYGYKLNVNGPIRLKFESGNTGNKRVNIDNIQMSDWEDPDGIDSPIYHPLHRGGEEPYNLQGQPVGDGYRGIIIQNAKKQLVH